MAANAVGASKINQQNQHVIRAPPVARRWHRPHRTSFMGVKRGPARPSGEQRMPSVTTVRILQFASAAMLALTLSIISAHATSRIKDLANIEGVRQNQLIGYGLVVGLNG